MVSTKVEVRFILMKMVSMCQSGNAKFFLTYTRPVENNSEAEEKKSCAICGLVRNVFEKWLAGERKLPGFEGSRCENIWS